MIILLTAANFTMFFKTGFYKPLAAKEQLQKTTEVGSFRLIWSALGIPVLVDLRIRQWR
jgi:hypothetical protein